jgi:hypothetical protein
MVDNLISGMLCDFREGDEVILPSFTHAGTASKLRQRTNEFFPVVLENQ